MANILADQLTWQILAVVLSIVAIITAFGIYRLGKKKKAIGYEIIQNIQLVSINGDIKGRVELYFNKNRISDVSLVLFRVINLGNEPIVQKDFIKPIKVSFGKDAKILEATIESTSPLNLEVHFAIKGDCLEINTPLLNPQEDMTFKLLISQYEDIRVDTRIVGVTKFEDVTYKRERYETLRESILFAITIDPLAKIYLKLFDIVTGYKYEKR